MYINTLNVSQAYALAKEAIRERGTNFVYTPQNSSGHCEYFHTDGPGCIVGLIMSYLGYTAAQFAGFNSVAADRIDYRLDGLTIEHDAGMFLRQVQIYQDSDHPWGMAVQIAATQKDMQIRPLAVEDPVRKLIESRQPKQEAVVAAKEIKVGYYPAGSVKPVHSYNPMTESFEEELKVPTEWVNDLAEVKAKTIEKELIDA